MLRLALALLIPCAALTTGSGLWPGGAAEQRKTQAFRSQFPGASDDELVTRVEEFGAQVEERRARRGEFDTFLTGLRADLLRGGALEPAVERLLSYCLRKYPEHIEYLTEFEAGGGNLRAKLARNLVRGLRHESDERPHDSVLRATTTRLGGELVRLGYEAPPECPLVDVN